MRQDRMAISRARDAGVGADLRRCSGGLWTLEQSAPPGSGAALLMSTVPQTSAPVPLSSTLQLTQALIARQSVSPADGGCQALMIERLEAIGFRVERLRFGPVDNFWAERGSGGP